MLKLRKISFKQIKWVSFQKNGCHFLQQISSQLGSQKLLQGLVPPELTVYLSVFNLFLTWWTLTILSKGCKPNNFEPRKSLKLSFTYIWGLHSNFVESESFLESNSPDILSLCETNLNYSIDSSHFSVRGYLPLIRKDSITHMHVVAVYVKEGLPFARELSLESSEDSYLCFHLVLHHSVPNFLSLYQSPPPSL